MTAAKYGCLAIRMAAVGYSPVLRRRKQKNGAAKVSKQRLRRTRRRTRENKSAINHSNDIWQYQSNH